MKIIDQYIYAVGQKLPLKGRSDVKVELKSLLLDDIENRFGETPTEEEVSRAIADFGSPRTVARRYAGERLVIAPGFTDIYYLLLGIIAFALTIAFTVIFFIGVFSGNPSGTEILKSLGTAVLNIFNSWLSAVGMMSVIFIIVTRFLREGEIDLEDDWTPAQLKGIKLDEEAESKIGSFVSLFFLLFMLTVVNFFPGLLASAERAFETSGMILGNHIVTDRFAFFAIFLSILWIADMVYYILILKSSVKSRGLKIYRYITEICKIALLLIMTGDSELFTGSPDATLPALMGFRGIFLLIGGVGALELLLQTIRMLTGRQVK